MKWRRGVFRLYLLLWIPWVVVTGYALWQRADFSSNLDWRTHFQAAREMQESERWSDSFAFAIITKSKDKRAAASFKWHEQKDSTRLANEAKRLVSRVQDMNLARLISWASFAVVAPAIALLGLMWALSGFSSAEKEK
jgi:hypothetical protein